jgi:hypothetical protein
MNKNFGLLVSKFFWFKYYFLRQKKFEKRGPKFLFMGKNGKKIWGVEGGV